MARFLNGANGNFRGKVGSVIGSSWKGIHYIKGLYKKSTVPATEAQRDIRERFRVLMNFFNPLPEVLKLGFGHIDKRRKTPMNIALRRNFHEAVLKGTDGYALSYPDIRLSSGGLMNPSRIQLTNVGDVIIVDWGANVNWLNGTPEDRVVVLLYNVEQNLFLTSEEEQPLRSEVQATVEVPEDFVGQTGHAWFFVCSANGKRASETRYLGELTFRSA